MTRCVAIIVAAGTGSRSGLSVPKQFTTLGGRPVLAWSVDACLHHPSIDRVFVVVGDGQEKLAQEALADRDGVELVQGGAARSDSVRNALSALEDEAPDHVLVHDAARPGLTRAVIDRLLDALKTVSACAPALPVADALKKLDAGHVASVSRDGLYRVQTPQAFRTKTLKDAHARFSEALNDDLEAVERLGETVQLVEGDARLLKLTYPEDFEMAERLLLVPEFRTGSGFDVHAFEPGDAVSLCGVEIPHVMKLKGHSDADVAWHALTDAIYGALAAGDIGDHFPPTDPQWKGEPSRTFLVHAAQLARHQGFDITNVDLTVICEAPKIKPHRESMRQATADVLEIGVDRVSVKATTTEGLGFTGRREGIAAQASVSLNRLTPQGG